MHSHAFHERLGAVVSRPDGHAEAVAPGDLQTRNGYGVRISTGNTPFKIISGLKGGPGAFYEVAWVSGLPDL